MNPQYDEMRDMADHVAKAIHRQAVGPDDPELWEDLDDKDRNDFRLIAHAAMAAFGGWLAAHDLVIAKVDLAKPLAAKGGLVLPDKPKLVLPGLH